MKSATQKSKSKAFDSLKRSLEAGEDAKAAEKLLAKMEAQVLEGKKRFK